MPWLLLTLALLPAAVIIILVYRSDRYDREPIPLLFLAFFFGVLSTLLASLLESLYQMAFTTTGDVMYVFLNAVVGVGLIEEYSKWIFLRYNLFRRNAFNEPLDGIIYSLMIAMGFAAFENVMYVYQGGIQVALMRAFTAVPAHAAFGIIMGYYAGKAKFSFGRRRSSLLTLGLLYAALLHGLYDFFLLQEENAYLALLSAVVLIFSVVLGVKAIRRQKRNSPFNHKITEDGRFYPGESEQDL